MNEPWSPGKIETVLPELNSCIFPHSIKQVSFETIRPLNHAKSVQLKNHSIFSFLLIQLN